MIFTEMKPIILLRLTSGFVNRRIIMFTKVKRGEHHFGGSTYSDVNQKNAQIVMFYDTVSLFVVFEKTF